MALREQIVALAQRHRRYGAGMIYLKLRQAGHRVNHKRVDRLYAEARLHLKRRRRKKVPTVDRQPLVRPRRRNEKFHYMEDLPGYAGDLFVLMGGSIANAPMVICRKDGELRVVE